LYKPAFTLASAFISSNNYFKHPPYYDIADYLYNVNSCGFDNVDLNDQRLVSSFKKDLTKVDVLKFYLHHKIPFNTYLLFCRYLRIFNANGITLLIKHNKLSFDDLMCLIFVLSGHMNTREFFRGDDKNVLEDDYGNTESYHIKECNNIITVISEKLKCPLIKSDVKTYMFILWRNLRILKYKFTTKNYTIKVACRNSEFSHSLKKYSHNLSEDVQNIIKKILTILEKNETTKESAAVFSTIKMMLTSKTSYSSSEQSEYSTTDETESDSDETETEETESEEPESDESEEPESDESEESSEPESKKVYQQTIYSNCVENKPNLKDLLLATRKNYQHK
jgi:phage anti-repressor protein